MPPRQLTAEEKAFVKYWSGKAFYFIKMIRRADVYVRSTSRKKEYRDAYKEFANSGQVIGGEWNNLNRRDIGPRDRRSLFPKPEERDAYIKYLEDLIDNHPPTSPLNAVKILFAGNSGLRYIGSVVVMERPERVQTKYHAEFHELNNMDLKEVYGDQMTTPPDEEEENDIVRDPDEDHTPFVRARDIPYNPEKRLSPDDWTRVEKVGETYFFKDEDDTTGFAALQLVGILMLTTGKFYMIRFEETSDSYRMSEEALLGLIEDGLWY